MIKLLLLLSLYSFSETNGELYLYLDPKTGDVKGISSFDSFDTTAFVKVKVKGALFLEYRKMGETYIIMKNGKVTGYYTEINDNTECKKAIMSDGPKDVFDD